jgi:preprotein translocase SecE subunit
MSEKKPNPVKEYAVESVMELKKVTWPTGKKALRLTIVVLSFCLVAAAFIGLADLLFNFGYTQLLDLASSNKII